MSTLFVYFCKKVGEDMHYISSNVKKFMEHEGLSLSEFSRRAGISKGTISRWFNEEKTPRLDIVERICAAFEVPLDYFLDDSFTEHWKFLDGKWEWKDDPDKEATYEVAAGQGRINESQNDEYNSDGRLAKVVGDSMEPSLYDGDIVRFVEAIDVEPKDFALVRIDGESVTIKHIEWAEDGLWIRAENKEVFKDRFYTIKEIATLPVQVVGKAVEVRRKL